MGQDHAVRIAPLLLEHHDISKVSLLRPLDDFFDSEVLSGVVLYVGNGNFELLEKFKNLSSRAAVGSDENFWGGFSIEVLVEFVDILLALDVFVVVVVHHGLVGHPHALNSVGLALGSCLLAVLLSLFSLLHLFQLGLGVCRHPPPDDDFLPLVFVFNLTSFLLKLAVLGALLGRLLGQLLDPLL